MTNTAQALTLKQIHRSYLWYGPPGTGKTTAAAKLAHHRKLWIDIDQKLHSQSNLTEEERSKIEVWTPNVPLDGASPGIQIIRKEQHDKKGSLVPGTQAYVPKDPKGYMATVEFINSIGGMNPFPYDLVVVDSLTKLVEHMEYLIYAHHKVGVMSLPLWGVYKNNVNNFINGLLALPCDVILIAHAKTTQDELTDQIWVRPMIDGQSADKLPKDFNEVYYFMGRSSADKKYYVKTVSDRRFIGRTTLGFSDELPIDDVIEKVNSTIV
jgi:hypothetical protein